MILVTGGFASGRHTYVRNVLKYTESEIAEVTADLCREYDDKTVDMLCSKKAVIVQECGCGLVPIDENEKCFREQNGKLSAELASRADHVVRIVCGIAQNIK